MIRTAFGSLSCLIALSVVVFGSKAVAQDSEGVEFFERKVRPVLATHCLSCHGPKSQKGGLRLDSREAMLRGGTSGPVVVEGDDESSLIVDAVGYDSDPKMPPKGKLPAAAIDDIKAWVKMGAPWPAASPTTQEQEKSPVGRSWAFQPVQNPPYPLLSDRAWPKTSVDWFVLDKLDARGIKPSPPADRRTMIRRWSFTLTGLPPRPEEVTAYEQDASADADQKVVDRLLASPHYGERWGRHWLDVARYADTKGYVFLEDGDYPWAYTYRDYVVRSINADLPYDRFVVEQIAADQLPLGNDKRPLAALGFLTVGGRFMNNVHDIIDDRIDVTTRGLMGLTVTCARCHDHKFDPIPTADYYSLYGVFASSVEPSVAPLLEPPPKTETYKDFERELKHRETELETFVRSKYDQLIEGSKTRAGDYLLAAQALRNKPKTDDFMLIADGHDLNPTMIGRWRSVLDRARRQHDPVFAPWLALADIPVENYRARASAILDEMGRRSDPAKSVNPVLLRALAEGSPASLTDVAAVYERVLNQTEQMWLDSSERARRDGVQTRSLPDEAHEALRQAFHGKEAPPNLRRSALDNLSLIPDRPSQEKLLNLKRGVETWRSTGPGAPPRAMALVDLPHPIEPHIFQRGNPSTPGPAVPRQFLESLSVGERVPFQVGSGRLELARAIVDRDNPLTARVLVNRVWMLHFGSALVDTPGDLGSRSDPPSNPELLDHLATAFMNDGWSLKSLHRRIVLSAAYRQASDDRPEARQIDPENRYYWRMNRRRLDWEATRDSMLAVSGRLDATVGGPAVKDLIGSNSGRRTLYGMIDRLNVPGLYRSFDFPDPHVTSSQRVETSVPPQALFFMNHPLARETASGLHRRADILAEPTVERKLARCFSILYGRRPDDRETAVLREFLGGSKPSDADWQRLVQALLLSNEFAFID
jgi:hypothetical protein